MPESSVHPLEAVLRACAALAPEPLYPVAYAKETGISRETLDSFLDQLRMVGLVRLTDWVAGHGQGYALTPTGEELLKSPRQLARLVDGKWVPPKERSDYRQRNVVPSPWERGEAVREALLYPVQPRVTFALIIINVVAFIFQTQNRQFMDLLVADPFGLLENQWWRLLTTAFLHAGRIDRPWHLAMNMFALYSLGRVTETIWGHWRFLAIYLISAFAGSCLALITQPVGCIGASGAVCGIFASWAGWLFYNRRHLPAPLYMAWQRSFLVNVVLIVFISFIPGVSWAGHLGGALAGLALAICFCYFQSQAGWLRSFQWGGVIIIPLVSFGLLMRTMNSSAAWRELREESRDLQEEKERQEINNYLPRLGSMDQKAQIAFTENAKPLLEIRANRRKPEEVNKAFNQLDEALRELQDGAAALRNRRPFTGPFIEKVRQTRLQLTDAWITLLQMGKDCIQKGEDCTEKEEEQIKQQEEQVVNIRNEWRELLKSNGKR